MTSLQAYDQSSDLPPGYQLLGPDSDIINAVMRQESRDNPNAVSSKGARGLMQTMPGTETDPGYGVTPIDPSKPLDEERARVGRDYLGAMLNKYGDLDTALVAYNWGPSRTDHWIKAGGDRTRLPSETRNYVAQVRRNLADASQGSRESSGGSTAPLPAPMRLSPPATSPESDVPSGYALVQDEPSTGYTDVPKGGVPTEGHGPVRARDLFLRSMIGQGAMAGFGDEAEAATRATAAKAQGDKRSWSKLYDS